MTTSTNPPCAACGNGMNRRWGTDIAPADRAVIELDGTRYPVHRGCIKSFVASPAEAEEAWESQRRTVDPKQGDIEQARAMRSAGRSLFEISTATGRSKEWLRTHAGLR